MINRLQKEEVINYSFRITVTELKQIKKLAEKYTEKNVSAFLRKLLTGKIQL